MSAPKSNTGHIPTLTHANFEQWWEAFHPYITGSRMGLYLDGKKPTEPSSKKEGEDDDDFLERKNLWASNHFWVIDQMNRTIDAANQSIIRGETLAHRATQKLKDYHGNTFLSSVVKTLFELLNAKLEEGGDIHSHLANLRELSGRLSNFKPSLLPTSATTSRSGINIALPNQVTAAIFLNSLPDSFDLTVSAFFNGKPEDFTSAKVLERIQSESVRFSSKAGGDSAALKADVKGNGKWTTVGKKEEKKDEKKDDQRERNRPKCTYTGCGKVGHSEDGCYKKAFDERKATRESKNNLARTIPAAVTNSEDVDDVTFLDAPIVPGYATDTITPSTHPPMPRPPLLLISFSTLDRPTTSR
ncbi:hypothetical protein P7C70_g1121, partial [Phenoliferia sp. Uapishka_3]